MNQCFPRSPMEVDSNRVALCCNLTNQSSERRWQSPSFVLCPCELCFGGHPPRMSPAESSAATSCQNSTPRKLHHTPMSLNILCKCSPGTMHSRIHQGKAGVCWDLDGTWNPAGSLRFGSPCHQARHSGERLPVENGQHMVVVRKHKSDASECYMLF